MKLNAFNLGMPRLWLPNSILLTILSAFRLIRGVDKRKLIMRVNLIIFILFTSLVHVSASGFAQKITYAKKDATLEQVFFQIEKQTGFQVLYSNQKLNDSKKISVSFNNTALEEVLDYCLKNQALTYQIDQKVILISTKRSNIPNNYEVLLPVPITGKISDVKGQALIGVSISIKGKRAGVVSDASGRYTINIEPGEKLVFSMIGFKSQEITANSKQELNLILQEEISELDQFVVTGYGKKKISELTGALVTIKGEDLRNVTSASIMQNIQGKIAGMIVNNNGGDPAGSPNITIRGIGSLGGSNSTQPLIVIDGLIQDAGNLGSVSPNDVASVTVLKDAASTSLYGSRAANGVIVITTKGASISPNSKPQINLESTFSLENPVFGKYRLMNSAERYDLMNQAYTNDYRNQNPGKTDAELQTYLKTVMPNQQDALAHDTDWLREGYRTGQIQRYNLSLSGASEKFTYYLGGTYHKELPVAITDKFEKYSIRVNTEYKPTSKLTITTGFNGTFSPTQNSGISNYRSALYGILPWDYPMNADGSYRVGNTNETDWFSRGSFNPLYSTQKDLNYQYGKLYIAGLDAKVAYSFTPWLDISSSNRITLSNNKNGFYIDPLELTSGRPGGYYSRNITQNINYITSNIVSFKKQFGLHELKGLAGFEFNDIRNESTGGSTVNITSGIPSLASGTFQGISESISEIAFLSYLSEANYSYDNKYFVSGSFRRDGSSKFGANNKYGNFYSVGGSWTVSNEDFLKDNKTITNLRVRLSQGTTGNADPVGAYSIYGVYGYVNGTAQYDGKPGIIPGTTDDNPDLHWEVQHMTNLGLNISFWKRLNLSVDLYNKANTNILRTVQAPITSGVAGVVKNIGKISNKGIELDLNSLNLDGVVKWNSSLNLAFNRNKVVYLTDVPTVLPTTGGYVTAPGYAIGTLYGVVYKGADPETGKPSYEKIDENGNKSNTLNIKEATLQILDSQQPDFSGGLSNTLSYKGLSLSVLLNFVSGLRIDNQLRNDLYNVPLEADGASKTRNNVALPEGQTRWQKKGDQAFAPAATILGYADAKGYFTTRFVENASYLRVRNIRLDYTLPAIWTEKAQIQKARLFVAIDNAFTITKFSGLDPESGGNNYENGSKYPINRKFTLGMSLTF